MASITQRCSWNRVSWKVKQKTNKKTEKYLWKSSCSCLFLKDFTKMESYVFLYLWKKYFQGTTHFFWIKIRRFLKQKIESFGPSKTTLYFWLKINFRKMASNKHIRKEKRGDIWQLWKNLKPQDHSILPLNWYSFMTFEMQAK